MWLWRVGALLLLPVHAAVHEVRDADTESMSCFLQVGDTDMEQPDSTVSLTPVGRTFVTNNIKETTDFFKSLFRARETEPNMTYDSSCMEVVTLTWTQGISFTFVQYTDGLEINSYVDALKEQWGGIRAASYSYTRWLDNHDGFNIQHQDDLDSEYYVKSDFTLQMGGVFTRFYVPGTVWNVEVSGELLEDANKDVDRIRAVGPPNSDKWCRVPLTGEYVDEQPISLSFWWKSTFASQNPVVASHFAVKYLFGTRLTSEYPRGQKLHPL